LNHDEVQMKLSAKYTEIEAERSRLKKIALQEFQALTKESSSSEISPQVVTETEMKVGVNDEGKEDHHQMDVSSHENEWSEVPLEHSHYDSNESDYSDTEFESSREDASENEDIDKEKATRSLKEIWSKRTKEISQRIERVERIGMDMLSQEEPDEESAEENEE
jgi:hypothetical protein